jgi:hypothetical protein
MRKHFAMNEDNMKRERALGGLQRALEDWARHGNEQPLTRWLGRELDSQGAPIRLPISDWHDCLKGVLKAQPHEGIWPSHWDEPITRLVQTTLWFTRRDGVPVTELEPAKLKQPTDWTNRDYANHLRGPCVERAIQQWMSKTKSSHSNDRRPAWGGSKRVLDVLRPGWPVEGDFLAIDHRVADSSCRFELFGAGRSWLGPLWKTYAGSTATSAPKTQSWISDPAGSMAEWSYRAGGARITQSALILRGRSLALLSMLVDDRSGPRSNPGLSVSLPRAIAAAAIENSRAFLLTPSSKRGSAQVLPIGLPSLPYPTERGAFLAQSDGLVLNQASAGRRCWLPLLVSWDSKRHRKEVHWRVLSVSENARNVAPDRAFAVRVRWGRDETYVIYRSLGKPAPRAFLGHQTTARFLIGLFKADGFIEPILKVD